MATTAEHAKGIGVAALRKEDRKFLTGRGRYVDDIKLPGMLHMAIVRSQMPHADVTGIDTAAAAGMPGVTAVLTADDLEFAAGVPCASNPTGDMVHPVRWPLAKGRVRHVGEPIAVVLAADRYAARDAADAVVVDYAELPAVTDVDAALADGASIRTVEGLANGDELTPLQQAFSDHHALQCGYCTPGMVMTAIKLLEANPEPSDEEIRHGLEGNLCRCTGYENIVAAVRAASGVTV